MLFCYCRAKARMEHYEVIRKKYLAFTPYERKVEYDIMCADKSEGPIVKYLFDLFKATIVSLVVVCLVNPIGDAFYSIIESVKIKPATDVAMIGMLVFFESIQLCLCFKYEYELKYVVLSRLVKEDERNNLFLCLRKIL